MKKHFSMFALLLALALILTGCGSTLIENINEKNILGAGTTKNDVKSIGYELLLENENIEFHMNPNTTEFAVVNKKDKSVWYSNNSDSLSESGRALLHLEYTTSTGSPNQVNSFENAVTSGQYKIDVKDDKVSVSYSIGNFTSQVLIPELLTPERYEELYSRFTGELIFDQSKFRNYYTRFDISEMQTDDIYVEDTIAKYPILKEKVLYVVSSTVISNSVVRKDFSQILSSINYTKEDFAIDSKNYDATTNEVEEAGFNITLEFSLDGGDLIVNIPNDKIEMYADFPLTNITLLKYFGAQSSGSKGYFVLPDGSGSTMNFYNGKTTGHPYVTRVYGAGYSLSEGEKTNNSYDAALPIFGISCGKKGIFAEITSGDTIAEVSAYSGDDLELAYVAPIFHFRETFIQRLSSGRKEQFSTIQKKRFPGDMSVRYSFLSGKKQSSYTGMADFYRERLFGDSKNADDKISVMVEYIGMIQKQAQIFGVAYDEDILMTDFNSVSKYAKELKDAGINNLNIKLSGWFGTGYNHDSLTDIEVLDDLGGYDGLKKLSGELAKNNIAFWPDVDVQYTLDDDEDKAIRTIDKNIGATYAFDLASFNKNFEVAGSRRVNNMATVKEEINGLIEFAVNSALKNYSLRSIGESLNADFNEDNFLDQQSTMNQSVEQLKLLNDKGISFITSGANAYVFDYAEMCLNTPLISNQFDSTDLSIPFLQMVIRGNVSYAGAPINLTGDLENAILSAAQTGANIYYTFAGENANEIVDSHFSNLYSIDYTYHKDKMIKTVKKYQADFEITAGQTIADYVELASGVSKTTFENGSVSYVNMNNYEVKVEGIKLAAKSYIVKKG